MTRVGIIGYNNGNGHPYSFSAIINGYDQEEMDNSPYPGIAKYLSVREPDEFGVNDFRVTHVWCPDKAIALNIAACTNIPNVVDEYLGMLGAVDAVIIARDDVRSHFTIAKPFLENGIPTFIDKPLCDNINDLGCFKKYLKNGLLLSCSGLRYLPTIINKFEGQLNPEEVLWTHSVSIIDWFKYGIHVLEGIVPVLGAEIEWVQNTGEEGNDIVRVQYLSGKYSMIHVNKQSGFIIRSTFYTNTTKHYQVDYNDNFSCFRNLLFHFYNQVKSGTPAIDPEETITLMKALYAAHVSREEGGRKVYLNQL